MIVVWLAVPVVLKATHGVGQGGDKSNKIVFILGTLFVLFIQKIRL